MEKIKEMIVVEGKHDTATLKRVFDCDTIETHGASMPEGIMDLIEEAARTRGIIVFTDPDTPGEMIRRCVMAHVPEAKHVFIDRKKARTDKKVGVEHASDEDIRNALMSAVTFVSDQPETLSWQDFIDLGLAMDKQKRLHVCDALHIGPCNAKTCFKRLNQMQVDRKRIEAVL